MAASATAITSRNWDPKHCISADLGPVLEIILWWLLLFFAVTLIKTHLMRLSLPVVEN